MLWVACGDSMRLRFSARAESGSILVEFLGSALLIIFALLGVAQMSIWVWSRGVVVNAAHEGARAAAEVDASIVAAEWTTRAVLRDGLGTKGNEFTITASRNGGSEGGGARRVSTNHRLYAFIPNCWPLDSA